MSRRRNRPGSVESKVPAYLEALAQLAGDLRPGSVNHVEVKHDSWCDQLAGRGPCNCKPEVRMVKPS